MAFTRIKGVEVLEVTRTGSDRLSPQSPLVKELDGVVMVRCVGCGSVAVFDWKLTVELRSADDCARGFGTEKSLDARRRRAPGVAICGELWECCPGHCNKSQDHCEIAMQLDILSRPLAHPSHKSRAKLKGDSAPRSAVIHPLKA